MGIHLLLREPLSTTSSHMRISQMNNYVPQILNIDDVGKKLYEEYVSERINGNVSLWAPVKKRKEPHGNVSGNKKHIVKVRDKTKDL